MLNFQVVKAASTYNAIMGRTGIHAFMAVPSTYHMVLKFPTKNGVGESRGDQKMARSCYVTALRPDGTEGLVFPIEDMDAEKMMNYEESQLRTWLNIDPTRKAVKQKKRTHAPYRLEAIKQEVEKLLKIGFIEEIQFPECGYNQIRMHKDETPDVSFITDFGLFCYLFMAFGLKNAGATYQRLVNKILAHLIGKTMEVYVNDKGKEANRDKIKSILDMESPHSIKCNQKITGRIAALGRFISNSGDKFLPFFKTLKKAKDF
ncbi:uncharacterized protein LOC141700298 [Apium graveolens]|uniref:uncharacterized protein LOC141700298 n=1 Tax=Apium graveolens TaxID=4045 RepID=UPI003D7B4030